MAGPLPIKCVVVGPSKSGKTSLLLNLTTKETVEDGRMYTPTIFDNYATSLEHEGQTYELRSVLKCNFKNFSISPSDYLTLGLTRTCGSRKAVTLTSFFFASLSKS